MATAPRVYQFPQLFRRLSNQKQQFTKHFIDLRESKSYRLENQTALVPGLKMLRELRDDGFKMRSLVITAEKEPHDESAIKHPAIDVLKNPDAFPAKRYFVCDVDLTRRILGTASRPGRHEIFAELELKPQRVPDSADRLLVFDHVNDPGNLGNLVRTGMALGWDAGLITTGTCDMYNDKTIRASRGLTLKWPHKLVPVPDLVEYLRSRNMTPVVADMMPSTSSQTGSSRADDVWTPPGSNICFWNFQGKTQTLPQRPALILSSEHRGVKGLDDELRVSVPMARGIESLNVSSAGSMLMHELDRLLLPSKKGQQ
ncbi:Alpha/beta knot methyltransferase [Zychaea mexicana]|uniref:Alpha/beta knot methyltransferase n=1 Tax=Zychaea mexicana TaxID=64656 RepID=UPI0022FE6FFD|nr:Alpha/beta knot methyltransferase [Zychaea mexicana]KAI9495685.1 Alpha/beta knot methyltransferase [Zychaea mexicana]